MNNSEKMISVDLGRPKSRMILVSSAILLLAALILWKQQRYDDRILIAFNYFFNHKIYIQFFQFLSRYGMGIIALLFSLLIFLSLRNGGFEKDNAVFIFILFSFAIGGIAGDLIKEIVDRSRPVFNLAGAIAQTEVSDSPSFPSGHTVKSMALALPFVMMALNKYIITRVFKITVLSLAILVSFSRIALQKHYLSDVLSGISVALFFMLIAAWVVNRMLELRKFDNPKLMLLNKRLGFVFIVLAIFLILI
jgi:membrane-associated phospholipid phosphatase